MILLDNLTICYLRRISREVPSVIFAVDIRETNYQATNSYYASNL
jgi:hypothetical protein